MGFQERDAELIVCLRADSLKAEIEKLHEISLDVMRERDEAKAELARVSHPSSDWSKGRYDLLYAREKAENQRLRAVIQDAADDLDVKWTEEAPIRCRVLETANMLKAALAGKPDTFKGRPILTEEQLANIPFPYGPEPDFAETGASGEADSEIGVLRSQLEAARREVAELKKNYDFDADVHANTNAILESKLTEARERIAELEGKWEFKGNTGSPIPYGPTPRDRQEGGA